MRFALINGERREAEKELVGVCEGCGQPLLPICGPVRVKHWRHKVDCDCDHWWENEGAWHIAWKDNFPKEHQEIIIRKQETKEWHRADVQTKAGYILEFQHSFLKPNDRNARNIFYGEKLVWIVNGLRRASDKHSFDEFLRYGRPINEGANLIQLHPFIEKCSIIKEWSDCNGLVFFDFGIDASLWCLLPKSSKGNYYALEYSRQLFIDLHKDGFQGKTYSDLLVHLHSIIFAHENPDFLKSIKSQPEQAVRSHPPQRSKGPQTRVRLSDLAFLERILAQPMLRQPKRFRRF
jgi:hypothetical protein